MLELKGITKDFDVDGRIQRALNGVDLMVKDGELVTIVGSNGAGKSTLLNVVSGVVAPTKGSVEIDSQKIDGFMEHERARWVSRVFQNPLEGTAGDMTIAENLLLAFLRGKRKRLSFGLKRKQIAMFREALSQLALGLEERLDSQVRELSGGQRQALALILATISQPQVLLLDEHTAALDPKTAEQIMALTEQIIGRGKMTVLMVTHNLRHALAVGQRTIMMHEGSIVLDIAGEERKQCTVEKLIEKFTEVRGGAILEDRVLLAG